MPKVWPAIGTKERKQRKEAKEKKERNQQQQRLSATPFWLVVDKSVDKPVDNVKNGSYAESQNHRIHGIHGIEAAHPTPEPPTLTPKGSYP